MISFIIRICIVALLAIVGYNYFFGNAAEKAQSREVVQKARSLVGAGADLLRAEKARYREGKYDGVIEKLDAAYRSIRRGASHLDARVLEELETLEARKLKLRAAIDTLDSARVHSKDNRPPGNAEESGARPGGAAAAITSGVGAAVSGFAAIAGNCRKSIR
jgi:hypothetical protein